MSWPLLPAVESLMRECTEVHAQVCFSRTALEAMVPDTAMIVRERLSRMLADELEPALVIEREPRENDTEVFRAGFVPLPAFFLADLLTRAYEAGLNARRSAA